eukprot:CAMPEP_0119132988 /NCGR_PEP_ID=MMETSP1310-20130426/12715_1 /TAXON_ID=464262 /ORGANISM="Genus nov. species nov., Strain RCC2339" /LENGTH=374 /DNA_ID=CAMNT_0007123657 /DNA_START=38 /DNA_END=1162 /DNA_ORIENTATION=-
MELGRRWVLLGMLAVLLVADVVQCLNRDFYKILGVPRDASERQIKKAYRKLAVQYHPDKNKGDDSAKDRFQDINAAYEVLSDSEKRRKYDQLGEEGMLEAERRPKNSGFGGIFGDLFGFNRGSQSDVPEGETMRVELMVSLEDIYSGKELRFLHRKQVMCHKCRGLGTENPEDVHKCNTCKGTGMRTVTKKIGPGFVQQMQTPCDRCGGKGKIAKSTCPHCGGTKVEVGAEEKVIFVEKGVPDGHEVVFRNAGEERPDHIPGDLIFVIRTHPHQYFRRDGNDLHLQLRITLLQSLVGFELELEHLDGHKFTVKRSQVTTPGLVQKIPKEGMPHHEYPSLFGDLYVEYSISFPEAVSDQQKQVLQEMFAAYPRWK